MKKMSLATVLSLAFAGAALILGNTSVSAREFSAIAGTTFILVPVPGTSPQQFTHTVDGVAQVSSLGDCTVHFDLTVTVTGDSERPYQVGGTQIITTADGKSSVTSWVNGYLISNPANPTFLGIDYQLTFTSGTGQLTGAQGKTVLTGFAALALAPGYVDFPGTPNVYPPDADLMLPGPNNLTGKACWMMKGVMKGNLMSSDVTDEL